MIFIRVVFILSLAFNLISCNDENNEFDSALIHLERNWSKEKIEAYAKEPEGTSIAKIDIEYAEQCLNHFFVEPKDASLIKFFNSKEVYEQFDMEVITLTSFHRKLNNKPILLEEQIDKIRQRNRELNNCKKKLLQYSKGLYTSLIVGDIIMIELPLDEDGNNAVLLVCPESENWIKKPSTKKITVLGEIINKRIDDTLGEIFDVKILSMSNPSVMILMEKKSIHPTNHILLGMDSLFSFVVCEKEEPSSRFI